MAEDSCRDVVIAAGRRAEDSAFLPQTSRNSLQRNDLARMFLRPYTCLKPCDMMSFIRLADLVLCMISMCSERTHASGVAENAAR